MKHTVDSLAVASFYLTDEECKCDGVRSPISYVLVFI